MSAVLDFYQQQANGGRSDLPWLARLQEEALVDLTRMGFPTRHHEEWKYTLLDSFLQQRFDLNTSDKKSIIQDKQLPKGVIYQPILQAMVEHEDKIKPYLGHILKQEHAFHALNTALLQNGVFIYIPPGVRLEEPLNLTHWQDVTGEAAHTRHFIFADVGSEVAVVEDYQGEAGCSYFTNSITEVYAAKNARLIHYKIQRESKAAFHVSHLAVLQDESSHVESHSFSLGGKLVRSDVTIRLQQRNAHCVLNGIYAPGQGQHIDHHTLIQHAVPDCSSEQDYKGILAGNSRAVFNGKVLVEKNAQHTHAQQQNKNLLLSTNAEIDTKPQLEIFADDVICTHGATVGNLDENALFYLAARGISAAEASGFLIQAFAAENLKRIPNKTLGDWMSTLLSQQIG